MSYIKNASATALNANSGTLPNMGGALLNWFQPMIFGLVTKVMDGYQVVETQTQISFMGVWQPKEGRVLKMETKGQRRWSSYELHSDPSLILKIDDVIIYLGKQYRVIADKNYNIYAYRYYELQEDWTNSGPTVAP